LHAFAVAALRESRAHEGLPGDEAIERAELAAKLGPSLPGVQFQLARARFRAAPGEFGAWFGPLGAGFHAIAAEPRWCRPILADLAVAGLAGLLVAGAVVLVLLAIRYGRVAFHDFHHLFPRAAIPAQTAVLGALVVAAPAVLGQGPLWVGTVVAAAIWLHLARAERLVVGLWLAALGLAPFAAAPIGALVAWGEDDRGVWALERAGDFTALPALERRAAQPDARPEVLFAVARAKKRAGALEAADALYERALAARPSWPAALVNLGNVRLLRGREDEALALYGRAIAARPGLAVAYFDLSRLHYRRLDFGPGQEARNRAIELDRSLVDRYAAGERDDADPRANRYLLDVPLDARDLAGTVDRADAGLLAAVAASRLVGSIPAAAAPWTVGGILAGLLVLGLVGRNRAARSCQKCGRPVCRRCDPEVGAGELCGQCVHVYARREPVEPSDRIQKDIAVQRHAAFRRRARRALAFVLGAQVVSGRVWRGAALLAGAAALAAALWFPDGLVRPEPGGPPAFLRLALAGPALLVVWIVGVRDALGREG
jgi:tetratricopeptide (TPR) repeat protein